ncbi:hypothetical protein BK784_15285 [Bacillus thuringiensis serovar medellin]|uniref:Type I restriction modification DNA specificity domain-containing protein n=1 Tax=Bacillus thuringiensis subsp. medellin TaxID=79672 RepID=A0A9X6NAK9_BACTV|nr:restriction endonuclease subunit S [Bacillus thuringiensis]OUB99905.1 hypothetical protein BK784_15285 [Bacillus thuringiensis serovar medellin]
MKNNKKPEIRFLGYIEEWEQRKLDSIVDRVKSYSLSRDVETNEYTGYKYIHYGDIHTKVADVIDESSNLPNIKVGNYELLEKGDLVLADASEDYQGIATPAVITIDIPYKLVSGLHTIALRPKQVDPLFLYYLINSPTFRKYGYKTGTGMKVFGISVTNLLKFEGMFPLLEEQTKIGKFLKQLDDTIVLHQQELTTLKQTKQGFLQKMFPKEGASMPEIRFPGFNGAWEQHKLGQVVNITMGQSPNGENYTENPNDHILVQGNADIKNGWVAPRVWTTQVTKSADKGDIILSVRAPVGDVGKTQYDVVLGRGVAGIKGNEFIFQSLSKMKSNGFWTKYSTGSTFESINSNDLKEAIISVPGEVEQIKIGNFFKQLDDTISLHQRELEALKETKKAFLQKMFV